MIKLFFIMFLAVGVGSLWAEEVQEDNSSCVFTSFDSCSLKFYEPEPYLMFNKGHVELRKGSITANVANIIFTSSTAKIEIRELTTEQYQDVIGLLLRQCFNSEYLLNQCEIIKKKDENDD